MRSSRISHVVLTAGLSVAALAAAGCGGGSSSPKRAVSNSHANVASVNKASTPAAKAASAPGGGLSGTWSGQYGGAYSGTFNLNWKQAGSNLTGTIKLSAPAGTLPIRGTMNGGTIRFGTVGSTAITYTGTVSGGSMSGGYQTPNGGGSWSAGKA